ncbi:MAG: GntR family transcriptional regulator [Anaerolineae bacterium]|nr:GntR family transcriptional regulator [Anaerolineae bacterium]
MSDLPQLTEVQSKSRREQVLDKLRDAILDGDFKPGQPLREVELASQLGVSRAPLREALQVLSAEGLVETVPYHGTTVRTLNKTDIEELYSLRSELESFAIRHVIATVTPEQVAQLRDIYERMRQAGVANDLKRLSTEDQLFHNTLIALSNHSLLVSLWNVVAMRVRQVMALRNKQNRDLVQVAMNHVPIIDAIAAKDVERAITLIQQHAASAADLILDNWQYSDGENGKA